MKFINTANAAQQLSAEIVTGHPDIVCIYDTNNYAVTTYIFNCVIRTSDQRLATTSTSTQPYTSFCFKTQAGMTQCYNPLQAQVGIFLFALAFFIFTYFMVRLFRKS